MRTFPGCALVLALPLALATAGLASCDEPIPEDWRVNGDCPDPALGTEQHFEDTIKPQVLQPYCSLCHWSTLPEDDEEARFGATTANTSGVVLNYDVYASATSRNGTTWNRVKIREMPPMGATPTQDEAKLLLDFLNCSLDPGDDDDSAGDDDDSAR